MSKNSAGKTSTISGGIIFLEKTEDFVRDKSARHELF
jgi:hypothetical protein